MSSENWSEWLPNHGVQPNHKTVEVKFDDGTTDIDDADRYFWPIGGGSFCDIIAYRYRIKGNEMSQDLKWLALHLHEWPWCIGRANELLESLPDKAVYDAATGEIDGISKPQWLQARKDLGLIMTESEEELAAEDWAGKITDTPEEAAMVEDMVNGKKYDGEKPRMDLIPPFMEEEVAMVLAFGARKYDAENWRKVTPLRSRYLAAAQRHINALKKGEQMDPESGLHHAAHAACCLMFLGEVELEPCE